MASGRGTDRTVIAWGLAGVPILLTVVQTALAMLETTLGSAGFGAVQRAIRSIDVFDAAALLMWESPTLVFALFILIAGAWMSQGIVQFRYRNRDLTFAAAGLVSVLFFVLFLSVYSPLLNRGVPTVQTIGFFSVPVIASSAAIGAAYFHDWNADIVEEKSANLTAVATDVERKTDQFEQLFRTRIGNVDELAELAPTGVDRAQECRYEFIETGDQIVDEIDATEGQSADQLRSDVASFEKRVAGLDPETVVSEIEAELREYVASGVRTTYGDTKIWSRYNRSYELVNLQGRFREVDLHSFDTTVHVNRVDQVLLDRIENGTAPANIAAAVGELEEHLDAIRNHITDREASFATLESSAKDDIDTAESKIVQFDKGVSDRLEELLIDGRHDELPSARVVLDKLELGKEALHDCQFDSAIQEAEDARSSADRLVTQVEFLWSVVGAIDHGGSRVSLPEGEHSTLVEAVKPVFEREYEVEYEIVGGDIRISHLDDPTPEQEEPTPTADTTEEQVRPEEIIDSVLFVFRELKAAGKATDGDRTELQTDDLPGSVTTPAVLDQIETFGRRQSDVLEQIVIQADAPPGFIELVPADGVPADRAIDTLHERYRERYG